MPWIETGAAGRQSENYYGQPVVRLVLGTGLICEVAAATIVVHLREDPLCIVFGRQSQVQKNHPVSAIDAAQSKHTDDIKCQKHLHDSTSFNQVTGSDG